MEEVAAELARNSAELSRLQRQAQKERARVRKQREHALLTATIAFCHEPSAGPTIAAAVKRKYAQAVDEDVGALTREIESRFLQTSVETLAQWLDWSDMSGTVRSEAQRFLEDARLLNWIGEQNSAQGIAPPPQFVWEKRCALIIDKTTLHREGAASWRPARSAAAKNGCNAFESAGTCASAVCLPRMSCRRRLCKRRPVLGLPKSSDIGPTHVRNLGSTERSPLGGRVLVFGKTWGSKMEPFFA